MTQSITTNTFGVAKWVVSADATQGTHTTIATALTSASSGDTIFIRNGTYTENITLKSGVNLAALTPDQLTPNVTISGTVTASFTGTVSMSGILLQTNGATACLATSGSNTGTLNLSNCSFSGIANTAITMNSATQVVNCYVCTSTTASNNLLFAITTGTINFYSCSLLSGSGASTVAAGASNFFNCVCSLLSVTTSGSGSFNVYSSRFDQTANNQTVFTLAGTGSSIISGSILFSGSGSAISIGTGTALGLYGSSVSSTNTNAITGAGTLNYGPITFTNTSQTINVTTQTPLPLGPVIVSGGQPCFLYTLNTNGTNTTGNGAEYVIGTQALTKVFDQASNMTTGGTFTAPYTGRYQFILNVTVSSVTAAMTVGFLKIITTARTHFLAVCNPFSLQAVGNSATMSASIVTDMTAGNTATFSVTIQNGVGNTVTVQGSNDETSISGYLVC